MSRPLVCDYGRHVAFAVRRDGQRLQRGEVRLLARLPFANDPLLGAAFHQGSAIEFDSVSQTRRRVLGNAIVEPNDVDVYSLHVERDRAGELARADVRSAAQAPTADC